MDIKQQAVQLLTDKLVRLERVLYGIIYLELTPGWMVRLGNMSVIVLSAMLQDMGVNAVPIGR